MTSLESAYYSLYSKIFLFFCWTGFGFIDGSIFCANPWFFGWVGLEIGLLDEPKRGLPNFDGDCVKEFDDKFYVFFGCDKGLKDGFSAFLAGIIV